MDRRDIEPILDTLQPWLSEANVVGLHVGPKSVDGISTEELAIVVHVIEKRLPDELTPDDLEIPDHIEVHVATSDGAYRSLRVPTDVIESGEAVDHRLDARRRPCYGGYQIQPSGEPAAVGTLGVNHVWGGKYRLITNNHVIARNDPSSIGTTVYQPSTGPNNSLATVSGYVPVKVYPTKTEANPTFFRQDIAWCEITPELGADTIYALGEPKGLRPPVLGERVRVIGAATADVVQAHIQSVTFNVVVKTMGGWVYYNSLVQLDAAILGTGDSGAAYVGDDDFVVGIHVGGTSLNSYGCYLVFH